MRVVEIETQHAQRRYVVMDENGELVEPIVHYLKYLDRIGSARQTLRSYATALRLYWEFLLQEQLNWQHVTLDDLSRFVLWLKLPSGSFKVVPAHPVEQARSNRTINHTLTVVRGFYDYHWRTEEVLTNLKEKTTTSCQGIPDVTRGFSTILPRGRPLLKTSSDKKRRSDNALKPSRRSRSRISWMHVLTSEIGSWCAFCTKQRCALGSRWPCLSKMLMLLKSHPHSGSRRTAQWSRDQNNPRATLHRRFCRVD